MARDLRHDLTPDARIGLKTVEPGLPGFLLGARRQHRDRGSRAIGVLSGPDARRVSERHGVVEVHGLTLGLGPVGVDQHDLRGQPTQKQSVGERGPNIAHAHDCHSNRTRFIFGDGLWHC